MQCFSGNDSRNIFENLKHQLKERIAELGPEELDSTDRNEWIDYWINQYEVDPVVIYPDNAELNLNEQPVEKYNTWHHIDWSEPEYFVVPGVKATYKVPYTGTPWFFEMRPSTFILCGHDAEKYPNPGKMELDI